MGIVEFCSNNEVKLQKNKYLTEESPGLSTNEKINVLYTAGAEAFFSSENLSRSLNNSQIATILIGLYLSLAPLFNIYCIELASSSFLSTMSVNYIQISVNRVSAAILSS
jgi:hypothetical protein